ncbi:MAG: OmpA family protein [Candidatus Binatia bacterium]
MRTRHETVATVVLALYLTGCAAMQSRQWGICALVGGMAGAAGGTVGALEGTDDDDAGSGRSAAVVAGFFGGAILGAVAGHLICDPPVPPPTPPPVAAAPPPPPPPPPPPTPAPGTKLAELKGPHFDFDRAELKPEGMHLLEEAVRVMKENATLRVSIEGHTDSHGSDQYNQRLSERRADAVQRYLVSQGIDGSRLSVRGFGESSPAATNDTEEGRAQNRRVQLIAQ